MTRTKHGAHVRTGDRIRHFAAGQSAKVLWVPPQILVPELAYGSIDFALIIDGQRAGRFALYPHGHGVRPKSFPVTTEGYILGFVDSGPTSLDYEVEVWNFRQISDGSACARLIFNAAGRGHILSRHGQHQLIVDPKERDAPYPGRHCGSVKIY
jgi:hypothetical protein